MGHTGWPLELMRDPASAVPSLVARLGHPDPEVRRTAAEMLGFVGGRGAVDALCCALEDPDAAVCMEAARALGALHDPRATLALAKAAARSGVAPDVRGAIAHVLGILSRGPSSSQVPASVSARSRVAPSASGPPAMNDPLLPPPALDRRAFCRYAACSCWSEETTVLPSTPLHRDDETSRRQAGTLPGGRAIRRLA